MAKKFELSVMFDSTDITDQQVFTLCGRDRMVSSGTFLATGEHDVQFHYPSWDLVKEAESKLQRTFGNRVNITIRETR